MLWLITHQNEENEIYSEKINQISELCNSAYHNMNRMKILDNIVLTNDDINDDDDDDIDSDNDINNIKQEIPSGNKIRENIDSLLNDMPNRLINKKNIATNDEKSSDVLLKIDINKLNSTSTLKYKNLEYQCR